MKRPRTVKRKSKSKLAPRPSPDIKEVVLPPRSIAKVRLPDDHVPFVAVDPDKKEVVIIPVKKTEAKKSWLEKWFG